MRSEDEIGRAVANLRLAHARAEREVLATKDWHGVAQAYRESAAAEMRALQWALGNHGARLTTTD